MQDRAQTPLCDPDTCTRISGKGAGPVGCVARSVIVATRWLLPEGTRCLPLGQKWGALRGRPGKIWPLPGALPAEVAQARRWASSVTLQGGDRAFCPPAPLHPAWPGHGSRTLPEQSSVSTPSLLPGVSKTLPCQVNPHAPLALSSDLQCPPLCPSLHPHKLHMPGTPPSEH